VSAWLLDHFELLGKLPPSHLREGHVEQGKSLHFASSHTATQAWHGKHAFFSSFEVASRVPLPS